ncbi:MAG TPA: serine/threonine-protein kinase, partial [Steroidobacteraceae bacterium]|nr:serine/threonine-protein kinase [Steroidobacteraceae bacterium]
MKAIDMEPEVREGFLQQESLNDPAVVQEVRALLDVDETHLPSKVTQAIAAAKLHTAHDEVQELTGTTLGPYKLISILGRGGSGVVYLGERAGRQFSARVAIKVVATAVVNSTLLSRFNSEEKILSSLDHPNIARLLDAGESDEGYPYLVMEYVHGVPIDKYCDENRLTIAARLELFLRICSAVQYAHKNLVVHRDLKPGNILVTSGGEPKLLDFGIAKLLATSGPSPALTRLNDRVLTPEYASPEQIAGRLITTSSDVYSLGVILYELLTGVPPYSVAESNQLELERRICIEDPAKPSVAVARAIETPDAADKQIVLAAAANRELSADRLSDTLHGDLDAIVMRALRKEPEKRYTSVEALASDVQRYLNFEPVEARQGNWAYYATRYIKRHTMPIAAAGVVAAALIIFSITTAFLYQRARVDRDHAERVSNLMSAIFQDANPYATQGHEVTALELLDAASQRIGELQDDPEVRGRLLNQMGAAYLSLDQYSKAAELLGKAVSLEKQLHPDNHTTLASTLVNLASAERGKGNLAAADGHYREAKKLLDSERMQESREYAKLLRYMGRLEHTRGDLKSAEHYYLESIAVDLRLNGNPLDTAISLRELASLYNWMNSLTDAERTAREALAIFENAVPEQHPDRVLAQFVLGNILFERGQLTDAAAMLERAVNAQRMIYKNNGPQLAQSLARLALVKEAQNKDDEAEALLRESLSDVQRALGDVHFQTGYY